MIRANPMMILHCVEHIVRLACSIGTNDDDTISMINSKHYVSSLLFPFYKRNMVTRETGSQG